MFNFGKSLIFAVNKTIIVMEIITKNKCAKTDIDWISPEVEVEVSLEEYRKEMKQAELSEKFSFKQYNQYINKWMEKNL